MRRPLSGRQFYPDKEENNRADDRHDKTGRMKSRAWFRFGEQAADQSAEDRATDPEQRGHDETELLRPWHDGACDQTDDETDDDGPNDV
jgi:hypothetical protein